MENFDVKLENLTMKYGLKNQHFTSKIENIIKKELEATLHGKKVAIWGAGDHTNELIKIISSCEINIVCIIDGTVNICKNKMEDYTIIGVDQIKNYAIDAIIISSFAYRDKISRQIDNYFENIKKVDIYDILEKKGKRLNSPFYFYYGEYLTLFNIRQSYENSTAISDKEYYLELLISKYIEIRDFTYAKIFIREYVKNGFSRYRELKDFENELDDLMSQMKNVIKSRQNKDILFCLVDSLRAKDVFDEDKNKEIPFIKNILNRSMIFTKAFSTHLFTRMNVFSMLTGKMPLDDCMYKKDVIEYEEAEVFKFLTNKGYEVFIYFAGKNFLEDTDKISQIRPNEELNDYDKKSNANKYISSLLWNYLCNLCRKTNVSNFTFLHFLLEIHTPHICGYHSKQPYVHRGISEILGKIKQNKDEYIEQYKECLRYLDKQFEFYFSFLPDDMITIILGDHGQQIERLFDENVNYYTVLGCHDDMIHVPLILYGRDISIGEYDKLFSMRYFKEVLYSIFKKKSCIPQHHKVEIQFEPIYNPQLWEIVSLFKEEKFLKGFKAIRTDDEKYIVYGNGEEDFYVLKDENRNLINESGYIQNIERMKKLMENNKFPNFDEERFAKQKR